MSATSSALGLRQRFQLVAAGVIGMLGFALLWAGFGVSDLLVLHKEAVAESAPADLHNAPLSLISKEQAALLQSTVDSTALSLSSVLASASPSLFGERESIPAIASALSTLTFGLGGEIYFTAWEDTRLLHSPLAPDAEGMDFADALDGRGAAFVLNMARAALSGGGFLQVSLPRQFSGAEYTGEIVGLTLTADDHGAGASSLADATPVDQVVYVRQIPRSTWHIAAFTPADARPRQGFSPVWSSGADKNTDRYEADYRRGLCVSGFSLAGLAGLILIPGHGRVRREQA
ncbi:MAG: hypothetical protein FWG04_00765 [Desulfovibrionaceae bacterium]|nr:hypothetical protein [Desulfovibrionaceae bacterium]